MSRIIYKRRRVSHIYLWVTIELREIPGTPVCKRRAPYPSLGSESVRVTS
jgi:hypothetical protein